ncbi:hypothetical protein N1027_11840 [Herbiconiux sp. CPCC 205763]|uniref:Uncharacterized protein n=1 Tax=Herbiconiux aconitum TaxID=2970913 RepID=A0ABT2GRH9_9MICO|nr:hypothetical protein [Herbiconiux aconitum]MCS5718826.1 hypothetical protein [Herbiconiux aconitum]
MLGWVLMALAGASLVALGFVILIFRRAFSRWQREVSALNRNMTPTMTAVTGFGVMTVGVGFLIYGLVRAIPG